MSRVPRGLVLLACVPPLLLAAVALAMHVAGLTGVDTAAHVYKIDLLRQSLGSIFWDDLWYEGMYGIIDYGPLYYLMAAVVPSALLVVIAAGSLPLLLHLYLRRVYSVRDYLPAAALAGVLCLYLVNGQDPFLVGLAFMLGGMVLLAYGRRAWAALAIGAALFCNPLSALTGGVFLIADMVARPDLRRDYLICAAWFVPFLLLRAALTVLFSEPGAYLVQLAQIARPLGYALVGALLVLSSGTDQRRHKLALFLTYAVVCVAAYALPSVPLGNNVNRFLMVFGLPAILLVRGPRLPLWLLTAAVLAVAWLQLETPARHMFFPPEPQAADQAFFAPALAEAAALYDPDHRIHVVAPAKHWEAYYFPHAGYPITRGWYRQADAIHNELFLEGEYTSVEYVAWLRSVGVELIFAPDAPVDFTSKLEPLILSRSSAFVVLARVPHWTIYRLRGARPLLERLGTGPDGQVVRVDGREVVVRCPAAGEYVLKVTWSPYWKLVRGDGAEKRGSGELARAAHGFVLLRVTAPGRFTLRFVIDAQTLARALP